MSWRASNWEDVSKEVIDELVKTLGLYHPDDFEAGADAMHKSEVEFLRVFHPGAYQQIQFSMNDEEWEAWTKKG